MQRFRGNPGKLRAANLKAERMHRKANAATRRSFVIDPRMRQVVRPVLIALMSAALASSVLVIAKIGTPDYRWYWLSPFLFLVALASCYSAGWLNNAVSRTVDRTLYRVSELVVIIALARLVSWALYTDVIPTVADIRTYLQDPLQFFLAGGFFTTAIASLIAWWFAGSLSTLFWHLDVSEEELRYYTLPPNSQKAMADDQPIQIPRQELQDAYLRYFLGGGIALVLVAALSTFEVREFATVTNPLAISRLGLQTAMLVIMMVYFLVGIWQLSHARLLRLNARWLVEGVAMDAGFENSWQKTSLFWLALIAAVAAFLPIGNTLPISRFLNWLVNGVLYLGSLLISFFGYLFGSVLASMQAGNTEQQPSPLPTYVPPNFVPPAEPAAPNPLAGIILSSAFWAIIIAVVVGAALFVARERGYIIGRERLKRGAMKFWLWLQGAWLALSGRMRRAGNAIPKRLRSLRLDPGPLNPANPWSGRYVRLNGLPPREQILYFYLSTVKRAGEQGVPRKTGETPAEYAADLKEHWPDSESEVEELTSAFVSARYSPADVPPEAAQSLKARWKRLRARLRRPNPSSDE